MESYDVTVQIKPLQQYFHGVLFMQYVVLTFESVDEILWCYTTQMKHLQQYFLMVLSILCVVLPFKS